MGSALKYVFESEFADRVIAFLSSRGERAHIIAPPWVRERVAAAAPQGGGASWSETPSPPLPKTGGVWNYIVLADNAGREREVIGRIAPHNGVKVYGFFNHIFPALLCNTNGMARQRSVSGVKRYALLCLPRCGSRYLASMLTRHGLGEPLEHLREPLASVITDGELGFRTAMSSLESFGQRNNIFGTKIISTFLVSASRNSLSRIESNVAGLIESGYQFVHLERPLAETVISSYIAFRLNKWHFFGGGHDATAARLGEMSFEENAALSEYVRFNAQRAIMDHLVNKFEFRSFTYAELRADVGSIVNFLCERLAINLSELKPGSAAVPIALREVSSTYQEFSTALNETLHRRNDEIVPRTIDQIKIFADVETNVAERILSDAQARFNCSDDLGEG